MIKECWVSECVFIKSMQFPFDFFFKFSDDGTYITLKVTTFSEIRKDFVDFNLFSNCDELFWLHMSQTICITDLIIYVFDELCLRYSDSFGLAITLNCETERIFIKASTMWSFLKRVCKNISNQSPKVQYFILHKQTMKNTNRFARWTSSFGISPDQHRSRCEGTGNHTVEVCIKGEELIQTSSQAGTATHVWARTHEHTVQPYTMLDLGYVWFSNGLFWLAHSPSPGKHLTKIISALQL